MSTATRHVASALVATTVGVLPVFLFGGLAPLIRADLGFDAAWIGAGVAVYFGTSALASVHGGRLGEHLGSRRALWLGVGISIITLAGIAGLAHNRIVLGSLLALGGIGNAIIQPAANLALARGVRPGRRGLAFGLKQAAIPTATALGGFAVPVLGITLGWRAAFAGAAVLALAAAALPVASAPVPRPDGGGPVWMTSIPRSLYLLTAGILIGSGTANSMGAYLVEAITATGYEPGQAGTILGLGSMLGIVARVSVGWLSDRMRTGWLRLVAAMMMAGAVGFGALALMDVPLLLGIGVPLAFAGGWGYNGLFIHAVVRLHPDTPASATGVTQAGAFAGPVIVPPLFGLISHNASYAWAWSMIAVMGGVAALLIIAARRSVFREQAAV